MAQFKQKAISMIKPQFPFLLASLLVTILAPALHAATGDSQVARWKDNRAACFLLMFDDSMPSAFQVAVPELVKRNMIATFYVNPGKIEWTSNAQQWETLIPQKGMIYGNHTWDHSDTTTLAAMDDEIRKCNEKILGIHYPGDANPHLISYGQPGVNAWYSYGAELNTVLAKYHLISRPPFNAAHAAVYGITTIPPILALADSAITAKGMQYFIIHGMQRRTSEGDPDMGFQDFWAFDKDIYRGALDGLKIRQDRGDLWITDHISSHKYETERNASSIAVTSATPTQISLSLTATTSSLYDLPLTVRTQVPTEWKAAVVVQDSKQVSVPVTDGTIQYDALPNAGAISITESPLPVVTVNATSPEAYETGAVPGVFTISTTGTEPIPVNYTITGTGANGARYTMASGPLNLASPSATINVTPLPNAVYEGEQSVVITLTAGSGYTVGTGNSAVVMIHDRTDVPPADWYLRTNQGISQHWNTHATWWSQPVGGVQLTAFSRGTVNDRFHTNGFEVRTKNSYYPPEQAFDGNNIVLDGSTAKLNIALTAYYGSSGMPTNRIPSLTTHGGTIAPVSAALTQILTVGTFNSQGTTKVSNGGNATFSSSGVNLKVTTLKGTGELLLTNAVGTTGTLGSTLLNISNATNYRGKLNLAAGTLSFPTALTSSGPLTLAPGSAVTNNSVVKVARLSIGNAVMPAGIYTAAQLNGKGVTFSGTGTITTSLLPDGWSSIDIGAPSLAGSATYTNAAWTVAGGGTQIGGTADKFNFTSALTTTGTPSIVAEVTAVQNTHANALAGVMLRDSMDTGAVFAALTVSPTGVINFHSRAIAGGTATSVPAGATVMPPVWLKLEQSAGTCTGSYSVDGTSWIQVGNAGLAFANSPQAGLATCAGIDTVRNTSTFSNVAMENLAPVLTAYTVSTSSGAASAGAVAGSGIFQAGSSVTVSATPASGHGFTAWSENGSTVGTSPAYAFTVNGNRDLVANFQPATLAAFKSSSFSAGELGDDAISGSLADPDGDGFSNLAEYALAMNPKLSDIPVQSASVAEGRLSFTHKRSKTAADLTYIVEVSDNLKDWKSSASDTSVPLIQSDDGYTQTVLVNDLTPPSSGDPRFIRLRIIGP
jgi:peptidoglycan/xylan/chitin deacetylase (PgdA/CDA1 family)